MTSTSLSAIARGLLDRAISGGAVDTMPPELLDDPTGAALFGILAEGLADRFDPALCGLYAQLFSQAIASAVPGRDAASLVARYRRVRTPRPVAVEPHVVFVLSRVTLGADIAVTSVLLDAAKRRFRSADIVFVGPRKNYELFAGDRRIHHAPINYRRGSLRERLAAGPELSALLDNPGALTIDPDSRLTQLGLLPVCAEERYHLFESRAYGGDSARSLPQLAAAWAAETLGIDGARPYVAPTDPPARSGGIAVSLGVGENPAKRIPDPFEEQLFALLAARGLPVCVDRGAGGEEADRVARAIERSGLRADFWDGSFAGFAAIIASSRLYLGYDSAGQHVAAASGVPLISVFAGFPAPRMFDRWRPAGDRARVIRMDRPDPAAAIVEVSRALESLL